MSLMPTEMRTDMKARNNKNQVVILKGIPVYLEKNARNKLVKLSDVIKAEQVRIAEKYQINIFNIYELALLYVDVKQRGKIIKQKYRFNKMLFYIWKRSEDFYGENGLIFDEMGVAEQGPIPTHLMSDLITFQNNDLLDIFIIEKGMKIPNSKKDWEQIKSDKEENGFRVSLATGLSKKGEELAREIWNELDPEMREIILDVKEEFYYMKTGNIRRKIHKEYPTYRKTYTKEDRENFKSLSKNKKPKKIIEIKELSSFNLTFPLYFHIENFKDGLIVSEPTIPLNIALENFNELESELIEYLDFLIETYIHSDLRKLAPEAKELRLTLQKRLGLED